MFALITLILLRRSINNGNIYIYNYDSDKGTLNFELKKKNPLIQFYWVY